MTDRLRKFLPAVALAAALAAGGAQGAVITLTFGGKVSSVSYPGAGLGGQPVVGADFTATFRFDEALGVSHFTANGSSFDGLRDSATTNLMGVTVTLGGASFDFRCNATAGSLCWTGMHQQDGPTSQIYASLDDYGYRVAPNGTPHTLDDFLAFTAYGGDDMLPSPDFRTPFDYSRTTPIGDGMFRFYEDFPVTLRGSGLVTLYSVSVTSDAPPPPPHGAPEPPLWSLTLAGLGLAGAALRRARLSAAGA